MHAQPNSLQNPQELEWFCDLLSREGIKSFLEIGSKFGSTLAAVALSMPKGSKVVSIDMPGGTKAWKESEESLKGRVRDLKALGYDASVIWGDSTNANTIELARRAGPYDAVFIDANHTLPYVTKDWENYAPMGKIVAFHDINWRRAPEWEGTRIDVPEFWNEIKKGFRHEEIRLDQKNNGIGVLWR